MLDRQRVSWDIEGQPYEVEVDLSDSFYPCVVDIYAESGERIPAIDYDAHGFDDSELDLIVATAYKQDRRDHDCKGFCRC